MDHPLHGVLMRAASELDLPTPTRFSWVFRGSVETVKAEFVDAPAAWMRVPRASFGLASLLTEQTAISKLWAYGLEGLPVAYRVTRVGPVPVAAHHEPLGIPGVQAAMQNPVAAAEAAGRWIGEVPDLELQFGSFGDGAAFRPRAATWADEVALELHDARNLLAASGLGLGALEETLTNNVLNMLPDLKVDRFAVVHRDLVPQRCTMLPSEIGCVFGWERAWAADPLAQWAPLVLQPAPLLAAMIRGAHADHVYDPAIHPQLLGYASLGVLSRLASQALTLLPAGHQFLGPVQAKAAADACHLHRLAAHLEEAREGEAGSWSGWAGDPVSVLVRRYLRVLAERNRMLGDAFEEGLAAALVAAHVDGSTQAQWLAASTRVIEALEEPWQQPHPVVEPSGALSLVESGETAWAARAEVVYGSALDRLQGAGDPAANTGLQIRRCVLTSRDRGSRCSPVERLQHGLMKVAAEPTQERVQVLVETFELCAGLDADPVGGWEEVAREVVLGRAPALLAARVLPPDTLPFDPLQIVVSIEP